MTRRPPTRARRRARPAIVLLLIVVVVTLAALTGGAVALAASTERAATSAGRGVTQARLAALSGVQAAMAELADQREALLTGEDPEVTSHWTLANLSDGSRLEVRLLTLDDGAEAIAGGLLIPESSRLDLNAATSGMLEALGIDPALAQRIVDARNAAPFTSVTDLLRVSGVTPDMLGFGAGSASDHAGSVFDTAPAADAGTSGATALAPPDLASLVTVFAFDPNIQGGIAGDAEQFRGRLRVNLDQPWSERLKRALIERFGEDAATGVERIMRDGTTFSTDADIIKTLRRLNLPPDSWDEILDVFTTTDDEFLLGRVDVRSAPEAVLAALPGISPAQARDIVAARDRLAAEAMRSTTWLVTEGLLTPDDFVQVVDHVTSRCMQWRVRVEGGIVRPDPTAGGIGGLDPSASGAGPEAPLTPRVVLEAVIDVASQRPRIAYLRDITLLEPAASLLDDPSLSEDLGLLEGGTGAGQSDLLTPDDELGSDGPSGGDSESATPRGDAGSRDPGSAWQYPGNTSRNRDDDPDAQPGAPVPPGDPAASPDDSGGDPGAADSEFKDRRIGRWTAGSGSMSPRRAQGGAP